MPNWLMMHEHIPNSRLAIFEESGHLPWVEEPEHFIDAVKGWLGQTNLKRG